MTPTDVGTVTSANPLLPLVASTRKVRQKGGRFRLTVGNRKLPKETVRQEKWAGLQGWDEWEPGCFHKSLMLDSGR